MLIKKTLTAVALFASLLGASAAFAHAHLKASEPAADSSVSAPAALRLTFSEGIEATFTKVSLSKDGTEIAIKGLDTEGTDKKVLVVTPAAPLAAGNYKVLWNAVSVDTHKSNGEYSFKVGQ
jgi:methionine-rich copper-binding protein CopC